jgi:hypothetical protein
LVPEISLLKKVVAEWYALPEGELLTSRRGISNEPRDLAVYLIRHLGGYSLKETGGHFNFSHYSSVSSAIQRVARRLTNNPLKKKYDQLFIAITSTTERRKSQKQTWPHSPIARLSHAGNFGMVGAMTTGFWVERQGDDMTRKAKDKGRGVKSAFDFLRWSF